MLVKSIMTSVNARGTYILIFCHVYLLKHVYEWLSHETLKCCSANYHASCIFSALNANGIGRGHLNSYKSSTPDLVALALIYWTFINAIPVLKVSWQYKIFIVKCGYVNAVNCVQCKV